MNSNARSSVSDKRLRNDPPNQVPKPSAPTPNHGTTTPRLAAQGPSACTSTAPPPPSNRLARKRTIGDLARWQWTTTQRCARFVKHRDTISSRVPCSRMSLATPSLPVLRRVVKGAPWRRSCSARTVKDGATWLRIVRTRPTCSEPEILDPLFLLSFSRLFFKPPTYAYHITPPPPPHSVQLYLKSSYPSCLFTLLHTAIFVCLSEVSVIPPYKSSSPPNSPSVLGFLFQFIVYLLPGITHMP